MLSFLKRVKIILNELFNVSAQYKGIITTYKDVTVFLSLIKPAVALFSNNRDAESYLIFVLGAIDCVRMHYIDLHNKNFFNYFKLRLAIIVGRVLPAMVKNKSDVIRCFGKEYFYMLIKSLSRQIFNCVGYYKIFFGNFTFGTEKFVFYLLTLISS